MRRHRVSRWNSNREATSIDTDYDMEAGIDEETLMTYPKLLYSDTVLKGDGEKMGVNCCSICLADYKMKDELRQLPECGHVFHVKCVDPWLRSHPTCPLCRTSPLPSPMPTPLAEVAPLAAARQITVEWLLIAIDVVVDISVILSLSCWNLHKELTKAIAQCEGSWSGVSKSSAKKEMMALEQNNCDWEIDKSFLMMGKKISSGSSGDLHHGTYMDVDVAIKVIKSEHGCRILLP